MTILTMYIGHISRDDAHTSIFQMANIDPSTTVKELVNNVKHEFDRYDAITVLYVKDDTQTRVRLDTVVDPNGTYQIFNLPFEPLFQTVLRQYREEFDRTFESVGKQYRLMYWVKQEEVDGSCESDVLERLLNHISEYLEGDTSAYKRGMIIELFMSLMGYPEWM